jgi:hypothetical protein
VPETYVCPVCRSTTDRSYRVTTIIRTCSSCGENGRFLHEELLALVDRVPVGERPEGWEEMPLDERLLHAVRAGHVDYDETELF